MPYFLWSLTPSSNATADPTINWAEGMAPSAVNDSARFMMTRLREFGNDIAGQTVTSGTSTAYTLSSNQVFDTLAHLSGQMIAFVPHTTNGAGSPSVTLNVDSLGAKPIRSAPSVDIASGTLVQGTPYTATYNNSDGAFYLTNFFVNPYIVPIGSFLDYAGISAPNSAFALPYGQAISRTTYATLFALTSTQFGSGDGSTTFNLPDLRGRFVAGLDNMGGVYAGRIGTVVTDNGTITSTTLGSTGGQATHNQTLAEMATYTPAGTVSTGEDSEIMLTNGSRYTSIAAGSALFSAQSAGVVHTFTGSTHTQTAATVVLPPTMMLGKIMRII